MSDTIQPGQWVRYIPAQPDAALAQWRQLAGIAPSGFRFSVILRFADGWSVMHVDNLKVEDRGQTLWEVAETNPAVAG